MSTWEMKWLREASAIANLLGVMNFENHDDETAVRSNACAVRACKFSIMVCSVCPRAWLSRETPRGRPQRGFNTVRRSQSYRGIIVP